MTPKELTALAEKRYDEGSPGGARALYLEAIESLEQQAEELKGRAPRWMSEQEFHAMKPVKRMILRDAGELLLVINLEDVPPPPTDQGQKEAAAKAAYSKWVDAQDIHCNRFESWEELPEKVREKWRAKVGQGGMSP